MGDVAARVGSLDPGDPLLRRGLHVGLAIALVLGVGLAVIGSAHELPDVEWRWRPFSLVLGVLGMGAFMVCSAELWRGLLHALGPRIDRIAGIRIWFVSGLGRFVPTSLLLPVIRVAAAEREGAPKRVTLASIVYEFALALNAALIVGAYSLITLPDLEDYPVRYLALAAPLIGLAFVQPAVFSRIVNWGLTRIGREPLDVVMDGWHAAQYLLLYILVYVLAGLSVYAIAQSVYPLDAGDIPTVTGAYALGTFIGVVAFALPGGLVAREAGVAIGLLPIMPKAPAIAIAVLARIVQISIEVTTASATLTHGRRNPARAPGPTTSQ
jgi:glycosyltransferase 2 family protein